MLNMSSQCQLNASDLEDISPCLSQSAREREREREREERGIKFLWYG